MYLLLATVAAANVHGGLLGIQQPPGRTSGQDKSNQHQRGAKGRKKNTQFNELVFHSVQIN